MGIVRAVQEARRDVRQQERAFRYLHGDGRAMLKIILVFAELERNMTNERVMATMIARATDKQWNGGRVNGWLLPVCLYLWEQATPQRLPQ